MDGTSDALMGLASALDPVLAVFGLGDGLAILLVALLPLIPGAVILAASRRYDHASMCEGVHP